MSTQTFTLSQLGWRPFYSQQLTLDHYDAGFPARVATVQRSLLTVLAEHGECHVTVPPRLYAENEQPAITVGDWVFVHREISQVSRVLERQSLIARMAAGIAERVQPIAANVDTLFIVTSCNADFNPSRLERYLAMAFEAQVAPVIVLTKADLCTDAAGYLMHAQAVATHTPVLALDATRHEQCIEGLRPWLTPGQTVAFVGSSGVGKSTLANSVLGVAAQATGGIREADSKGRHTTTSRHLIRAPGDVWLIDTPGMREIKIGALESGISQTFGEVEKLAEHCRFRDCRHQQDDGCALRAAVAEGRLDPRRLVNYLKLLREAERASQTSWQRHEQARRFGRMARAAQRRRREERGD